MSSTAPVICRYFASTGNCYYGTECNFAHTLRPTEHTTPNSGSTPTVTPVTTTSTLPKAQRPCRNVAIHGFCKFVGKGCEYSHDLPSEETTPTNPTVVPTPASAPNSTPSIGSYSSHTSVVDTQTSNPQYGLVYNPAARMMSPVPPVEYSAPNPTTMGYGAHYGFVDPSMKMGAYSAPNLPATIGNKYFVPQSYMPPQLQPPPTIGPVNVKANPVRVPNISAVSAPHPSALPHTEIKPTGARRTAQYFFLSDNLRQDFAKRTATMSNTLSSDDPRIKDLPRMVHRYHSLQPLEELSKDKPTSTTATASTSSPAQTSKVFAYPTTVYKCQSSTDGLTYVLRRVEGFRASNEYVLNMVEGWRNFSHPGVVTLREGFVSKEFGEACLVFVYDYHPGAITMESKYFVPTAYITEQIIWSFVTRLVSALKSIHAAGLSCKILSASKVLITGKNRLRINGVGIMEILNFEPNKNLLVSQQEDYLALGKLILNLACKSGIATQNVQKSIEYVSNHFSPELKNFVVFLLTKPSSPTHPIGDDVTAMINTHLLREIENLHVYNDNLESELAKELDSGRLFRLITKLGFINERPEFALDPNWSETGDRYLLKLFRDYVFHQVYEDGTPMVDLAHVVDCLNKLDAGSSEKIMLTSRDESSMLVVSYKDLKWCLENAFHELVLAAAKTPAGI